MSVIKPVDFEVIWCIFKVTEVKKVYFAFVLVTETKSYRGDYYMFLRYVGEIS